MTCLQYVNLCCSSFQGVIFSFVCFVMQLDDTIIKTIETAPDAELKEAKDLMLRIRRRNLYQVVELST